MKIDRHTTTGDLLPFVSILTDEQTRDIERAAVQDKFGEAGFYGMTVGQLTTILAGDPRPLFDSGGRTVFDTARVTAFRAWVDEISGTLKRLTVAPTAESMALNAGTMKSTFEESMYLFCRSYFGLSSFEAADRLLVSEFILAKKDDYNRAVIDRNVAAGIKKGGHK